MVTRLRPRLALVCVALLAAALSWTAAAAPPAGGGEPGNATARLDRAIQNWLDKGGPDRERVIVSVMPGRRGPALRSLKAQGFDVKADHPLIDAVTIEVPRAALDGLVHNPNIEGISLDAPTGAHAVLAPNGQTVRTTLGYPPIGAPRGVGVGIAIVDSGLAPASVFGTRIKAFYDFTAGYARATNASDPYGHGTHVAGLAAGSGGPSGGLYPGIAYGANLIGLRVLDSQGQGYTSSVISALEFAVANRVALGIDVINLSLGHPILESAATDPLVRAVEAAVRSGIVVVASAGNLGKNPTTGQVGYAGVTSPGNAPSAITVGATDTKGTRSRWDDTVAAYSSRGPTWYDGQLKPDLVAPGHALTAASSAASSLYVNYPAARAAAAGDATPYLRLNGTSMAAGVVSGVVATMIEAHRSAISWNSQKMTPNLVKAILQFTAIQMRDPATGLVYDRLTQGNGEVNAGGAIEMAKALDTAVPVGGGWAVAWPPAYTTISGQQFTWAQHIVWGDHIVWGSCLNVHDPIWDLASTWGGVDPTQILWSGIDPNHIVWGDVSLWSTHIVWGNALVGTAVDPTHIVWGSVVDAQHIVWGNLALEHIVWGDNVSGCNDTAAVENVTIDSVLDSSSGW